MKIKINENNKLTEYAYLGDLEDSIEVEDIEINHDLEDYICRNNKLYYEPDLQKIKNYERNKFKNIRDTKVEENITVNDSEFQVRKHDLENFYDVKLAVELKEKKLTDRRYWVLADNTLKEFTYKELIDVLKARANRKDEIYMKFGMLSMQLAKAQTLNEVEAIKWED